MPARRTSIGTRSQPASAAYFSSAATPRNSTSTPTFTGTLPSVNQRFTRASAMATGSGAAGLRHGSARSRRTAAIGLGCETGWAIGAGGHDRCRRAAMAGWRRRRDEIFRRRSGADSWAPPRLRTGAPSRIAFISFSSRSMRSTARRQRLISQPTHAPKNAAVNVIRPPSAAPQSHRLTTDDTSIQTNVTDLSPTIPAFSVYRAARRAVVS